MAKPNPLNDGKDHINVYSKGETAVGKLLSNFALTPFKHPEDGDFKSVEGYWYWLSCKNDKLRELYGFQAKQAGRELGGKDWLDDATFKKKIKLAIKAKIQQNERVLDAFLQSDLPFTHYYVYGDKVVMVPQGDWILDYLEELRDKLKKEYNVA